MTHAILIVAVIAGVTAWIRFSPALIFGGKRKTPETVLYLGRVLPFAITGMLVIYCLKDVAVTMFPFGIPEAICIAVTALLHAWKRNTLVSVGVGTIGYMLLVQLVF